MRPSARQTNQPTNAITWATMPSTDGEDVRGDDEHDPKERDEPRLGLRRVDLEVDGYVPGLPENRGHGFATR